MTVRSRHAEAVRALVQQARWALLSTAGLEPAGYPYGSLVTVAPAPDGRPLLLLSALAQHTRNLLADPRASLLLMEEGGPDPRQARRASLLGELTRLPAAEEAALTPAWLAAHPDGEQYLALDFHLWALTPVEARSVLGFGAAAWVAGAELLGA